MHCAIFKFGGSIAFSIYTRYMIPFRQILHSYIVNQERFGFLKHLRTHRNECCSFCGLFIFSLRCFDDLLVFRLCTSVFLYFSSHQFTILNAFWKGVSFLRPEKVLAILFKSLPPFSFYQNLN